LGGWALGAKILEKHAWGMLCRQLGLALLPPASKKPFILILNVKKYANIYTLL